MTIYWKGRTNFTLALGCLFVLAFSYSCKKSTDSVDSEVVSNANGFDVRVDTFDLIAYSAPSDSVDTRFLSYYKLGQMNDPEVGVSTANLITQYATPFNLFSFEGGVIDSVVLQIRYAGTTGYYGNLETSQKLRVFEITEDLPTGFNEYFYSNRKYKVSSTPIGSFEGKLNLKDSVAITVDGKTTTYSPQIRIKLTDAAYIQRLQNASPAILASKDAFKAAFKGLFVSAESQGLATGQGAIAYMNLRTDNPQTAVVVYAKVSGIQKKFELPISGTTEVKTNQYLFSNQPFLQPQKTGTHQNQCYVQPAGIKTRILIPDLAKLATNNAIAVQSARVIFTVTDTALGEYKAPIRLNLWDADSLGFRKVIKDFSEPVAYYDGYYNATNGSYTFNINRHVQNILTTYYVTKTDINYGLNLFVPEDSPIAANRAVLNTNLESGKFKFILTYTVIK